MANFYFEAIDKNNEVIKGEKVAANEEEVAGYLKLKNYTIVDINQKTEDNLGKTSIFQGGVSIIEKANFARNLATMIKSGLPITEAIGVISEDTKSKQFKQILVDIKYDLESGCPLSKALAKYPQVFDKVFVSLISAGELSGKMPEVLNNIYQLLSKSVALRTKLISAFTYPIVVLIALAFMGITMLIIVVPKILEVFTKMNIQLPFALKALNFLSIIFIKFWYITAPVILILIILIIFFLKSNTGQKFRSYLMRTLPYLSNLSKGYDMARMTSTLSMLLRSGVPMTDALRIVADGIIDNILKDAIIDCERQVKEGRPLSKAFSTYPKEIPNMLIKIAKVGEKSGKLDEVLEELGEYYNKQVDIMLKTMSDLVEPILMLVVGFIVAALVLSIISPIYGLVGSFSNK